MPTENKSQIAAAATWTSRVSAILVALLLAAQQYGLIQPKPAQDIKTVIEQLTPIIEQIEHAVERQKQVIPPKPEPTPQPTPTPIDDHQKQIQDLRDQIERLMDEIRRKNEPRPPVPVPEPVKTSLKILDQSGATLDGDIPPGKAVKVVAASPGDWRYLHCSGGTDSATVYEYPDHAIVTLADGAVLALSHASPTSHAMILVKSQSAPRPPPRPDDVVVKPRKLFIAVVEDVRNRSPETAITLSDLEAWNAFRDSGHEWRFYDKATMEQRGLRAIDAVKVKEFDPPQLVLHDLVTGEFVFAGVLPDMAGVQGLVKKFGGG